MNEINFEIEMDWNAQEEEMEERQLYGSYEETYPSQKEIDY